MYIVFKSEKAKKILKYICISFIILYIIFLGLSKITYNSNINKTITALMMNYFDDTIKEVEISIEGQFTNTVLKRGGFKGKLLIKGFAETEKEIYDVEIYNSKEKDGMFLHYKEYNDSDFEKFSFGMIYYSRNMKSFVILPFEEFIENPDYNGTKGKLYGNSFKVNAICYPAENREEAMALIDKEIVWSMGCVPYSVEYDPVVNKFD